MKPRVVIAEVIAPAAVDLLSGSCDVDLAVNETRQGLLGRLSDAAALVVRSATRVDAQLLDAAPLLKVVGRAGVGVDNIDLESAAARGVLVVNAPDANTVSAAEHTFTLLLGLARHLPRADRRLRSGVWDRQAFVGVEVDGKVLGVLGLGKIGSQVSRRAAAFGMRVLAYDPYISAEEAARTEAELVGFDDLLSTSDFITIHLPKTDETQGVLDSRALAKTKPGVRLVNTSRGGILDETALAAAIRSGHVAGAALDAFAVEPTTDSSLFDLPEVVVTPHLAASTVEAQHRAGLDTVEAILEILYDNSATPAVNGSHVKASTNLSGRLDDTVAAGMSESEGSR